MKWLIGLIIVILSRLLSEGNRKILGITIISVLAIGLLIYLFELFRKLRSYWKKHNIGVNIIRWLTFVPALLSSVMLLLAIPPIWPYDYYILLRIVVCASSVFYAIRLGNAEQGNWMLSMFGLAIIFNPVVPLHLGKGLWVIVDLIAAGVMLISGGVVLGIGKQLHNLTLDKTSQEEQK